MYIFTSRWGKIVNFYFILLKKLVVILDSDDMGTLIYIFRKWSCLAFFYCNNKEWHWEKYLGNVVSFSYCGRILERKQCISYAI